MCGIFGIIGKNNNNLAYIKSLSMHAKRRGSDSSGILLFDDEYSVQRADFDISKLTRNLKVKDPEIFLGIGRLITNDNNVNQPFLSDNICVFHNGNRLQAKQIMKVYIQNKNDDIIPIKNH